MLILNKNVNILFLLAPKLIVGIESFSYRIGLLVLLGSATLSNSCADEVKVDITPLKQAHAHNDYQHQRPLLDALDHGFCSVEADVYLVEGELLVAHDRSEVTRERTLANLYLNPLCDRVRRNGGRVYTNGPAVTLLIDIKRDGAAAYKVLDEQLSRSPDVFTVVKNGERFERAVNVIITGDRPFDTIASDQERFAAFDGRVSDLGGNSPVHLMPLISDRWGSHFTWRGEGEMNAEEKEKLAKIVSQVHSEGRILRFWAIPDNPHSWKTLQDAGVDLLNTDDLTGLSRMLKD